MKSFPPGTLDQHSAILGKTGSGKTSTAKLAIEELVAEGDRICVLDPIKSDWWGLTSSTDGKHEGLPFTILGGPHGHVPLHSSAGVAIGKLVASGQLRLSIIDMARFESGGLQRFFIDFAETLIQEMTGVLYLVIEEAHEFAPKEKSGVSGESMATFWAKKLATAGRSKGIRLILATQRTQALHNALLGSCETMIVHRMSAPADQLPVLSWLKGNVKDKTLREEVETSLPSLKTGTGWLCSGEAGVFEKTAFPRISTYDNSATPTKDSVGHEHVRTATINKADLAALIGTAVAEADANDPKKLKERIVELEKQVAGKGAPANDPEAISDAQRKAFFEGNEHGYAAGFKDGVREIHRKLTEAASEWVLPYIGIGAPIAPPPARDLEPLERTAAIPDVEQAPAPRAPTLPYEVNKFVADLIAGKETLKKPLQKCIDAIAWWRKIGVYPIDRQRASVVAGFSPKASTFGVYIGELSRMGLVAVTPGNIRLTDIGVKVANHPKGASTAELRKMARDLLDAQGQKVFDAVYDAWPNEIHRDTVADALDLSRTASTCSVYIGKVAQYGIITPGQKKHVKAAAWLFPKGHK